MFTYIKFTSREISPVSSNYNSTIHQEIFKNNPELFEKYLEDCKKDIDIENSVNKIIDSRMEKIKKEIDIEMNNFLAKKVKNSVKKLIQEEKILSETD